MRVRDGHRLDQDWLLPPSMDEWLTPDHLARAVSQAVAGLDLTGVETPYHQSGPGAPPYDPALVLRVLIYGYLTQRLSSRRMAQACREDLPMMWLARGLQPRHTVLAAFRAQHADQIPRWMAQVVMACTAAGWVGWQLGAVDGSKIQANASKHKAMSYARMKALVPQLEAEIAALVATHGARDAADRPVPPDRLARLRQRLTQVQAAMRALEAAEAEAPAGGSPAAPPSTTARAGQPVGDPAAAPRSEAPPAADPEPSASVPPDAAQYNFTDPESAIMTTKTRGVQQAYNAQILVDARAGVIVGYTVSAHATDVTELVPTLDAAVGDRLPAQIVADAGYWSATNLTALSARGRDGYIAAGAAADALGPNDRVRKAHLRYDATTDTYTCPADQAIPYRRTRTATLGGQAVAVRVYRTDAATCAGCAWAARCLAAGRRTRTVERYPDDATRDAMVAKLRTDAGAAIYRRRKGIVEPVWGILKQALGFRQFGRRGLARVTEEFGWLVLAYNIRKLARGVPLSAPPPAAGPSASPERAVSYGARHSACPRCLRRGGVGQPRRPDPSRGACAA